MKWINGQLSMERNEVHKFVNKDGFTINSNEKEINTNFNYIGVALNPIKLEKLFKAIDPLFLTQLKRKSKTEIEYEKGLFNQFVKMTAKSEPESFLNEYAKTRHPKETISNLTKDTFLYIFKSNKYKVLDWDIEITTRGANYAIKVEKLFKYK